jgi:PrtD family type I secretion system ABC transporter
MAPSKNSLSQIKTLAPPLVVFSFVSNLTVLISPIFMMQVLDRVVPSGNISTLLLLLVLALAALALNAVVDYCRDTSLVRTAIWVEETCTPLALSQFSATSNDRLNHAVTVRNFLKGPAAVTALSIPWIPLFLFALYLIHPAFLGLVFVVTAIGWLIGKLAYYLNSDSEKSAYQLQAEGNEILTEISSHIKNAELPTITNNLGQRFLGLQDQRHIYERETISVDKIQSALTTFVKMATQICALALGAYLVVLQELTAGGMIGASIITAKTIGTLEGSIGCLSEIKNTRASLAYLIDSQNASPRHETEVEGFEGMLRAEGLIYPRGAGALPRLDRISFAIEKGECVAIVGDSGSGKTTLLHALAGLDPAPIGAVFLDETDLRSMGMVMRQKLIGFLPQQSRLLNGTLAENISSFAPDMDDTSIVRAARIAGVHGLISALPKGYDTNIGAEPFLLSAGQTQRVALARAIYARPKYLFLDEPNALLDSDGERQLCSALARLKDSGTTVVMVLHRSGIMGLADKIVVMDNGRMNDFGKRSDVLARMNGNKRMVTLPANLAALQDLSDWLSGQFDRSTDTEMKQKAILVASEMFNAAVMSGEKNAKRDLNIHFRFSENGSCDLVLTENCVSPLPKSMKKIKAVVDSPTANMMALEPHELAIAMVLQVADRFEMDAKNGQSTYMAAIGATKQENAASANTTLQ